MAFTYDPTQPSYTDLNMIRLLIGDTDSTFPLFTDNELNGLISRFTHNGEVDHFKAAGWALRALSVDPDRLMKMKDATSGGVALSDLMEQYSNRAEVFLG